MIVESALDSTDLDERCCQYNPARILLTSRSFCKYIDLSLRDTEMCGNSAQVHELPLRQYSIRACQEFPCCDAIRFELHNR